MKKRNPAYEKQKKRSAKRNCRNIFQVAIGGNNKFESVIILYILLLFIF